MVEEKNRLREEQPKYIYDKFSGEVYEVHTEKKSDEIVAFISAVYLLVILALFLWQLFDIGIGQFTLAGWIGYDSSGFSDTTNFNLIAYTFIGGGLGGIVSGLRSLLFWHSEKYVFSRRFIWKYIASPWIGTVLALFTYALIRSGVAAFGAEISTNAGVSSQTLAMFAIGALAGYGSREVFVWLDAQVKKIFKVASQPMVPELTGKTKDEAEGLLNTLNLILGNVSVQPVDDEAMVGKIINQSPLPESPIMRGGKVHITIATKKEVIQS